MTKLLLSWNEITERARKIDHNSSVKIEATTGRDEHIKGQKNSGTDQTLTRLGPISIDGDSRGVHLCMLQSRRS